MGSKAKEFWLMINCPWLPTLFECPDFNNWMNYENNLFAIFKQDFIDSCPCYDNKNVVTRKYPIVDNRPQAFHHLINKDYHIEGFNQRTPDLQRCARLKWVRKFIENTDCSRFCCAECSGIKLWKSPYKSTQRIKMFLEEERYVVIIELREQYCLLITAFYINYEHTLQKLMNEFEKAKSAQQ